MYYQECIWLHSQTHSVSSQHLIRLNLCFVPTNPVQIQFSLLGCSHMQDSEAPFWAAKSGLGLVPRQTKQTQPNPPSSVHSRTPTVMRNSISFWSPSLNWLKVKKKQRSKTKSKSRESSACATLRGYTHTRTDTNKHSENDSLLDVHYVHLVNLIPKMC